MFTLWFTICVRVCVAKLLYMHSLYNGIITNYTTHYNNGLTTLLDYLAQ